MLYHLYELNHAMVTPWRTASRYTRLALTNPHNPFSESYPARAVSAALDVFEGLTHRYGKPEFGIERVTVGGGTSVEVEQRDLLALDFCTLTHFRRDPAQLPQRNRNDPKVLIVAPMSGHYATLMRGTVKALLEDCDVYITDWTDARLVPLKHGRFDLNDYVDYILRFIRTLGPDLHVVAVCQPGPPVLAASALLAEDDDPCQPASVTVMGSPIDTRQSPTEPNLLAESHSLEWFERNVTSLVPFPHPGAMRLVYPGFMQLSGFMTMNLDRHLSAHDQHYHNLVAGDGDSVSAHRKFYEEYMSVMDLPAEFYLQTLKVIFQEHHLARGVMRHRDRVVDLGALRATALMTVEGEKDDISGIGQTQAAHELCVNIPSHMRVDYVQQGVGHYGVFNGSRWRSEIAPRIRDFIRSNRTLARS